MNPTEVSPKGGNSIPPPLPESKPMSLKRGAIAIALAVGFTTALGVTVWTAMRRDVRAGSESSAEPGITHLHDTISSVPWSIHVLKIDRARKDLMYYTPVGRTVLGVDRVSELAAAVPSTMGRGIAVVNGDFYERDNPRGLQIVDGDLVSAPSTVTVWWDANQAPHVAEIKGEFTVSWPDKQKTPYGLNQQRRNNTAVLYTPTYGPSTRVAGGRNLILEREGSGAWLPLQVGEIYHARVAEVTTNSNSKIPAGKMVLSLGPQLRAPDADVGAVLEFTTTTTPDLHGIKAAISGGPILIDAGKPFSETGPPPGARGGYSEHSKYERHPRSAIGWNATHLFLITVDGRQPSLSVGMTLAELADYMVKKLGCTHGMNFDGGASASLWMGQIVNDPCQGERPVANGVVVVRTASK